MFSCLYMQVVRGVTVCSEIFLALEVDCTLSSVVSRRLSADCFDWSAAVVVHLFSQLWCRLGRS